MKKTLLLFAVVAMANVHARELVIAERGKSPSYVIVRSAQASESEKYAAEELRDFLAKVTGVTLPLTTNAKPIPRKAIVIGEATLAANAKLPKGLKEKLGEDGFHLTVSGERLFICGSRKRGALYGVYEVLEKYAGCRWYASWHSVIPSKPRVTVPATLNDTQVPAFAMREPFWYDLNVNRSFSARLRVNGFNQCHSVPEKFGGDSFRFGDGLSSCHTLSTLLPPDEFFASHPEYFCLVNGTRRKWPSQPCLTNPEVLSIVTERVIERIRKDPGARFYGVSQNDNNLYCQCDACKAIDEEEESHAGTMVRFVNAVAEAVEKAFPNVTLETLAYHYTRKPPKKTRLRHNVVPCLCTIECDFARPLNESTYKENVSFCSDIEGWKAQTDQLYVWDYTTDFHHYTLPFANVLSLQGNLKFFRDNNVKEIFEQGAYQGRHGDFAELKGWLLAKLMWNPDQQIAPLLKDFFSGYYGKGAPFVWQYCNELHKLQAASSATDNPLTVKIAPENPAITDAFLERATELWQQAADATKDDKATSYNVRMGAFCVDYMRLERLRRNGDKLLWLSSEAPDDAKFGIASQKQLVKSLLARMDEAKNIRLAENQERQDMLLAGWQSLLTRETSTAESGKISGELQENVISCLQRGTWGEYVEDPKASDGRALKLFNTHHEWCCQFLMRRIKFEPGVQYTVRVRVRCEKASAGEAFWAGIYNPVKKQSIGRIYPTTDEVGTDYAWYEVCTWAPNDDEYLWIGPGRFNADGTSAIRSLWIDKIDFSAVARR